jgi:MFS family permease
VLGAFWIVDAGLQYQPFMFGRQFVPTYITGNASGQPEPISWLITTAGHFISPNVGVWNALFATVQVIIGVGLFYKPTVRPALVASFFWAFGVWFFGEGLGMLLTGSASALTGAPGSVFVYGLIGVMAWPRTAQREETETDGLASSAAAHGIGGAVTPLLVWSGYWLLAAVLFLLPANRVAGSVSGAITGMASGEPSWYGSALTHVGNGFGSAGVTQTWILAIASVAIALGPLLVRRFEWFLAAGALLSTLFWLSGQGLGGILTGSGTDPNTGPLIVVLALAMVPTVVARRSEWSSPASRLFRRGPVLAGTVAVAGFCALLLAATYPAAAATSGGSMSGMSGMSMSSSSASSGSSMSGMSGGTTTGSTAHCTRENNGAPQGGLDVTSSPNMSMGSNAGATMNMNGADASAAAGLNMTKAGWSYTGPALPTAESNQLLADGVNGPDDIHMAESGCASEPTFSQEINAFGYVQATSEASSKYSTPAAAAAAGYQLVSPADYPVTYWVNPAVVSANEAAKRTLDPNYVDGLVFAATPSGQQVLAAAMYVLPASVSTAPIPYGPLVQWHQRTAVCTSTAATGSSPLQITGVPPCATGSVQRATPYLTMVWQVPVAGGPLAIQPPDIQIVESAVMATNGS